MTREGQDGINTDAASMNHDIAVVAYYIDSTSFTWTAAEIAMFPNSVKVRIATKWTTRDGHVIDCENGDATPAQAAQWVHQRRADGYPYPMVYTSISNHQNVINALNAISEPMPGWWLAHYDNLDVLPTGALGKQYADEPNLDKSIWADNIPGVDIMTAPTAWQGSFPIGMDEGPFAIETEIGTKSADGTQVIINVPVSAQGDWNANTAVRTAMIADKQLPAVATQLTALAASVAGLTAAVQALSTNPAVTAAQIQQFIDDAVAQHVAITGTVQIGSAPAVAAPTAPNPA